MAVRSFSIAACSPKPLMVTLAPCAASARATARPMPEVEPVTSAVFPCSMGSPIREGARGGAHVLFGFSLNGAHCAMLLVAVQHNNLDTQSCPRPALSTSLGDWARRYRSRPLAQPPGD